MVSNRKLKRQRQKAEKKFNKAARKGKLRKYAKDRVMQVQEKRNSKKQKHQDEVCPIRNNQILSIA
jgi:hypothetical protein